MFTRRSALTLFALAVLLAACGGSGTAPTPPNLRGTWTGAISDNVSSTAISMTLLDVSGDIFGTGQFTQTATGSPTVTIPFSASGSEVSPSFTITITTSATLQTVTYTGTFTATAMTGTVTGSGFTGQSFVLTKQ